METPRKGQLVKLRPMHDRVQNGATAFGRFMPMAGREVRMDDHWLARLRDGDVEIVTEPAAAPSEGGR